MRAHTTARRVRQTAHLDDWLMTYADMITLLLCFFALFLSLSVTAAKSAREHEAHAQMLLAQVEAVQAAKPEEPKPQEVPAPDQTQPSSFETRQSALLETVPPAAQEATSAVKDEAPKSEAQSQPALIEMPQGQKGQAAFEQKGDRLTTVEMDSATFFDSGSSTLSVKGREVLHGVAEKIAGEAYKDYQITVEGHTDDTPINTLQFPSNWELSTARASAVVHFFLEQGLAASRLRAAGYADTFPKVPNRDEADNPLPANQAQNRRVVIKLERIEKPGA